MFYFSANTFSYEATRIKILEMTMPGCTIKKHRIIVCRTQSVTISHCDNEPEAKPRQSGFFISGLMIF